MVIQFYHFLLSPPGRGVHMTLEALGLKYDVKPTDITKGEQKTSEYLAINPRGKVPALVDGDIVMSESRAIAQYLCNKYATGPNKSLYPSSPDERATVDMVLYVGEWLWDEIVAYLNLFPILGGQSNKPNVDKLDDVKAALKYHEDRLKKTKFVAGDKLTIADFFAFTAIMFLDLNKYDDYAAFPSVVAWLKKMKALAYHDDVNTLAMKTIIEVYQSKVNPQKKTGF